MRRRDFIKFFGVGSALMSAAPRAMAALDDLGRWNTYRLSYRVILPESPAPARLWIPVPFLEDSHFQRNNGTIWSGNANRVQFDPLAKTRQPAVYAEWSKPGRRALEVSTIVKTLDRNVSLSGYAPRSSAPLPKDLIEHLRSTPRMPLDGLVKSTAQAVTKGAATPLEQARAIYDWVIANASFDASAPGSGSGDVKAMLEGGKLSGKSADINGLFVALARSSGIPARLAYGIRIDESKVAPFMGGYGDVSRQQHARAEFYLAGTGWVPVDASDVVMSLNFGALGRDDPRVAALKNRLFGSWEMNWVAYNYSDLLTLHPQAPAKPMPFFGYPHAELNGKPQDSLDPVSFTYAINSAQLVGTGGKF